MSDFACLDKLDEDDGLVAVLCQSNETKRLQLMVIMI